ncbi:TonB-dependent receptor domain-containing protein [Sphingomonas sp. FW199]|uniref:TonB-dependent receptor domain-containing protein n=1 Tax=Sphingomonas sp. FW199 TaxID=3400217 RepID=UPI003CF8E392
MTTMMMRSLQAMLVGAAVIAVPAADAVAQDAQRGALDRTIAIDLPAQPLSTSLRAVAAQAGVEVYVSSDLVEGRTAPSLKATLTPREAVRRLLAGTPLIASFDDDAIIVRQAAAAREDETITVTGTRLRGTPPAAPVTVVSETDIRNAGQADLGEVARSLPQNFGGGQNPGIGSGQGGPNVNVNVNGASTFNLRGIGPNATLTLLNGNRLSYSGPSAAIDVSAIPTAAVARVEIIADGASAIYGADAVAGVVNIILKRDYEGLEGAARIGASTDGGNVQAQANMVGGTRWSTGGLVAAYDYFQNSPIRARDRSFTAAINPDSFIYPDLARHSVIVSANQRLLPGVGVRADLLFKTGEMQIANGYQPDRPVTFEGVNGDRRFETFGFIPTLEFALPGTWTATLTASYGYDYSNSVTRVFANDRLTNTNSGIYDNQTYAVELDAQGSLFSLPAGPVKLAVGAGWRRNSLLGQFSNQTIDRRRDNGFGYAELFMPLAEPGQAIPLVHRLSLSGAVRVEGYSDSSTIATPKLGLIYAPVEPLILKVSFGESYKVPTLYQQYSGYVAVLLPVTGYGTAFPANSTYLVAAGANPDTEAERSRNLTLTAEVRPMNGLSISASYFDIVYRDRVAAPFISSAGALTNPVFEQFVTFNPGTAVQSALTADALLGLQNGTGRPYDPANVIAIVDIRDRNIATQWYKGVDLSAQYAASLGNGRISLTAAATWLDSAQQVREGLPVTPLSGQLFNPPIFKARGGATFANRLVSTSLFLSRTGAVTDARRAIADRVDALTTLDFTARIQLDPKTELSFNALNLLNARPDPIFIASGADTPFDTTNYSAVGRFLALGVRRSW